jgi:hypothetical protein
MKQNSLKIAFLVLALGLFTCWAFAEEGEMIDNPEYEAWASFSVGDSATLKIVSQAGGSEMEMEMKHELKSLDDDKAVITTTTTIVVNDQEIEQPPMDRDVPAEVAKAEPAEGQPEPEVEQSEETITVEAGTFDCEVVKTTMETEDATHVTTVWTCEDVPGGQVKVIVETDGETVSETELIDYETGEKLIGLGD